MKHIRFFAVLPAVMFAMMLSAGSAVSAEYPALEGIDGLKVVFDVSLGDPAMSNIVFGAMTEVYTDKTVLALKNPPKAVIVFHGPAVKLISTNRDGFEASDHEALDAFADTIRRMKKDGVRMEVCVYALKVLGVDPATILPEIDHVGNGFISVAGFQARGYSLITVK
jgi:intracellular sulfur oxidation DsrE/DsrF family protein